MAKNAGWSVAVLLGVVALSFVKSMTFSRYFVVLLPALIPWLAVRGALLPLNHGKPDTRVASGGRNSESVVAAILSWPN